jgi:hypothetical protein
MHPIYRVGVLAAGCLILGLCGCGKGTSTVSGKVTLEGKPLVTGSVSFTGADNVTKNAAIQKDGTFSLEGVPYGKVLVAVQSIDPVKRIFKKKTPDGVGAPKAKDLSPDDSDGWFPIPEIYGDLNKSGLSLNVEKPLTTYDIELKEK